MVVRVATGVAAAWVLALCWLPATARADDRDLAVQRAREAREAYAHGDFVAAARAYEESLRLSPRAAAAMSAALAWDAGGDAARAADDYAATLAFGDIDAADADRARRRLAEIEPTVGVLDVKAPADVRITVPGAVTGARTPLRVHLRDGEYDVRAEGGDGSVQQAHVRIHVGETVPLAFAAEPRPPPPPATTAGSPAGSGSGTGAHETRPPASSKARTWGWISLAAGAVLGGVSVGLAVKTLDERNSLCQSLCADAGAQTTVSNWRTGYYVTLGTAIAAAGVGVALLVLGPTLRW
jgi:hypothetical protein